MFLKIENYPQSIKSNYQIIKKLGSGSFGEVYLAQDKQNNILVALKIINKTKYFKKQKNPEVIKLKEKLLQTEGKNMMSCQSKNLIKCFGIQQNQYFKVMVLEYCQGGTLLDQINKNTRFKEIQAIEVIDQIIYGFAAIHRNKIIHRDLKSQNILVHDNIYKIADFGLSKRINALTQSQRNTILGTRCTMAPQVLRMQQYDSQADMWSLGIIYYQMLIGKLPFIGIIDNQQILRVIDEIKKYQLSNQSKQFLQRVLVINPKQRLRWVQLYKMKNTNQGIFSLLKQQININFQTDTNMKKQRVGKQLSTTDVSNQIVVSDFQKTFSRVMLLKRKLINPFYKDNKVQIDFNCQQILKHQFLLLVTCLCTKLLHKYNDKYFNEKQVKYLNQLSELKKQLYDEYQILNAQYLNNKKGDYETMSVIQIEIFNNYIYQELTENDYYEAIQSVYLKITTKDKIQTNNRRLLSFCCGIGQQTNPFQSIKQTVENISNGIQNINNTENEHYKNGQIKNNYK